MRRRLPAQSCHSRHDATPAAIPRRAVAARSVRPRRQGKAVTLAEVVVTTIALAAILLLLIWAVIWGRAKARRLHCRDNLFQFAKGMVTYLGEHGDNRFYTWPGGRAGCGGELEDADFGGAEWLAMLYWTKILPDPGYYICPSSRDANQDGQWLGDHGCAGPGFVGGPDGKLQPGAVSYAALGSTSMAVYERGKLGRTSVQVSAIRDDFPPNEPMACDDTEGTVNHGRAGSGGMNVLLFDNHVEYWPHTKVDLEHGVGTGELLILRN